METAGADVGRMRVLAVTLASGLLLWAAFPPFGLSSLAWLALVPLLWMALQSTKTGRRFYLAIWLGSTLCWLLLLQGVRHAHPMIYLGWFTLSAYLGVYLVLFVGLTRVAVRGHRWPLIVAAPIVWTGLELARGYVVSGFSLALLAHTQVHWTALIQVSEWTGAYGISFLVVLVNAGITEFLLASRQSTHGPVRGGIHLTIALTAVAAAWGYGLLATRATEEDAERKSCKIALLQAAVDTTFSGGVEESRQMHEAYRRLSIQACRQDPDLDVIVWPESMFPFGPEVIHDSEPVVPSELTIGEGEFRLRVEAYQQYFQEAVDDLVGAVNKSSDDGNPEQLGIQFLLGTSVQRVDRPRTTRYNAGILVSAAGEITARYFKRHLVMFGEYIPFGETFPWIYRLTPLPFAVTRGEGPTLFQVNGVGLCPNICFESIVPHFARNQLTQLQDRGSMPDAIVNITNDGWFRGSSILDLHLACSVFRAVELRIPVLISANTGISAVIDENGAIGQRAPRRKEAILIASVQESRGGSFYRQWGDWFAILQLLACFYLGWRGWCRQRKTGSARPAC